MTALLSVVVLAASTLAPPSTLSAPALCSSAPAPVEEASFGGVTTKATCSAHCGSSPDVSCSGSACSAVDQSCPDQRGYVTCDGTTYNCPVCSAVCTEGSFMTITVGPTCGCEDGGSTPKERYKCIGGEWVFQSSFCGAPFCPIWQ